MSLEKMDSFFNVRAETYDNHMINDLNLDVFYKAIATTIESHKKDFTILDLGCGTGLAFSEIFKIYPNISVTGIDLSQGMLNLFKEKFPDKNLRLICGSYFDTDYMGEYDIVLSTYSLHHFTKLEKLNLYRKILKSVADGGKFINGDYTCNTYEEEVFFQSELVKIKKEEGLTQDEFYHYDTPLRPQSEIGLLKQARFKDANLIRKWDTASIIVATK